MLKKFSLYGFLKNQQYYDYFLILAFRQMGLAYFLIGILIAFREIMVNLMEIPSGAIADISGKRKSMIFSFCAYIISFATFGICGIAGMNGTLTKHKILPFLFLAMFLFAIGDAFRTGTHKALIFTWLRINNRIEEKTKTYGYTRSWSKIGSAISVLLACVIVYLTNNFIFVFFFSIIPYVLNIINFIGYPKELDGDIEKKASFSATKNHLKDAISLSIREASLRRLILESMGFEGFFKASKDYLQPILKTAAIPLTAVIFAELSLNDTQKSVILIGPVFFLLFILSAVASRNAHRIVPAPGHEDQAARRLWAIITIIFFILIPAFFYSIYWIIILGFISLYIIQNTWRPILISRFDSYGDEKKGATILSIESQAKSVSTMIFAPILGLAIDYTCKKEIGGCEFWPIGLLGFIIAISFFITASKSGGLPSTAIP